MNNPISIDSALNPVRAETRSVESPLSNRELLQRQAAACATSSSKPTPTCTGSVFVGMLFNGTGNNEEIDYKKMDGVKRTFRHIKLGFDFKEACRCEMP